MSESGAPEQRWVEAHRHELVGTDTEAASERVRAAGFRPVVKIPRPGVAFATVYWSDSVSLICVDGVVTRVSAG